MSLPAVLVAIGNHAAASLTVSMDFVAFRQWMRDTGRSAWWIVPFFVVPVAIIASRLLNGSLDPRVTGALTVVAAVLYFWGVIEISGVLRVTTARTAHDATTAPTRG